MKSNFQGILSLIVLVAIFACLWSVFSSYPNALATVWLIVLAILLVCLLYTKLVIKPKIRTRLQQDIGLSDAEIKTNKTFKSEVKRLTSKTFIGDLAGYFWIFAIIFAVRAFLIEPFKIPSGSMQPTLEIGDYIAVDKTAYKVMNPITQSTWIRTGEVKNGDVVVFKSPKNKAEDWIKRVMGVPGDLVYYDEYNQKFYVLKGCTNPVEAAKNIASSIAELNANNLDATKFAGCKQIKFTYGEFKVNSNYFYHDQFQNERTETAILPDGYSFSHQTLQNPQQLAYSRFATMQEGMPVNTWLVPQDQYFMIGDNRDNSNDSRFVGFVPFENIVGKAKVIWFALKYDADGKQLKGVNWNRIFTSIK